MTEQPDPLALAAALACVVLVGAGLVSDVTAWRERQAAVLVPEWMRARVVVNLAGQLP